MDEMENKNLEVAEAEETPEVSAAQNTQVTAKKTDKPAKKPEKKQNFFARAGKKIAKWVRDLRSEAKKVIWPTSKQVVNNTIIVIVSVLIVAVFVAVLDASFGFVRDLFVSLF